MNILLGIYKQEITFYYLQNYFNNICARNLVHGFTWHVIHRSRYLNCTIFDLMNII